MSGFQTTHSPNRWSGYSRWNGRRHVSARLGWVEQVWGHGRRERLVRARRLAAIRGAYVGGQDVP